MKKETKKSTTRITSKQKGMHMEVRGFYKKLGLPVENRHRSIEYAFYDDTPFTLSSYTGV